MMVTATARRFLTRYTRATGAIAARHCRHRGGLCLGYGYGFAPHDRCDGGSFLLA
jgi:hypothetical protein